MHFSQAVGRDRSSPLNKSELSDGYNRWFEIIPADTPDLRQEAYRLRYQVYCSEHQYETPDEHPEHMEEDVFDCRSIHSLIINRTSGAVTGTVRLILPDPKSREASFPIQQICRHPLPENIRMTSVAEISRFAISKQIRKSEGGNCPKDVKCSIVLGLMRATVQMSLEYGISDWFAVMEPPLLRLLCRFGIHFVPLGPLVQYHGLRQPCYANVARLLDTVRQEHFDLWKFATEPIGSWAHEETAVSYS